MPDPMEAARRIAAMPLHEAVAAYDALREHLDAEYDQEVGPRRARARADRIAREQRGSGSEERTEAELEAERFLARYEERAFEKTLLAIRSGRYDDAIGRGGRVYRGGVPGRDDAVAAVLAVRRAELEAVSGGEEA